MLLRCIYIMLLEHPGKGFFGILGKVKKDSPSLDDLDMFVRGYLQNDHDAGRKCQSGGWRDFDNWLKSKGHFSCIGWSSKIIEEYSDGEAAFTRFCRVGSKLF